jgi:two-component sensor histidine kinase
MFIELLQRLRPLRGLSIWVRYALTAVLVFGCFGLRLALEDLDDGPFLPLYLLFVPAVLIAAFFFDRGSAFFAVGLSSLLGLYFFIEPDRSLYVEHIGEAVRLGAFLVIGCLIAAIVEALRKTVDELADRTTELTAATEELTRTRSELENSNRHRELLLIDINHRIKNHLASVAAGLGLSKAHVADEAAQHALQDAIGRLAVLGRVYERLHLQGPEVTLDSKAFLEGLCAELAVSIVGARPIAITPAIESKEISSQQAVSLGLIVNELVTNCVKYAFVDDEAGEVNVRYADLAGECTLQVIDNGRGANGVEQRIGTGTKLVKGLVGQMGGKVAWHRGSGTHVVVKLPSCER